MHCNRQQCLVAERLGLSVTVSRVRARECIFPFFFFSLLKVTNIFVLCVSGNCDVRGIRTTTVCDVTMMYSQERYMKNVPKRFSANLYAPCLENSTPFPPSRDLLLSFNNIQ